MATITTVIPVYNGEKHIHETLECLAGQTRRPDRVVIVDDGSTDATERIVKEYAGIKCDWAPNERNLGLFGNHNSAIRFASETKFLHILHANDVVNRTFFEDLVPLIESAPGNAMAYGGYVFVREDGTETDHKSSIGGASPRQVSLKEFLSAQTELKAIQVHSVVMKTDYRPIPDPFRLDLPQVADIVFHSQFAARCSQIWAHPRILAQVRIHEESASNKNIRNLQAWVADEWKAMEMVYGLMRQHGAASWTREQKLKALFAARSVVKVKLMRGVDPAYAAQIRDLTCKQSGTLRWAAARAVVELRDRFLPSANSSKERVKSTN